CKPGCTMVLNGAATMCTWKRAARCSQAPIERLAGAARARAQALKDLAATAWSGLRSGKLCGQPLKQAGAGIGPANLPRRVALAGQMAAAAAWAAAKGALPHRLHARARLVGRAHLATHAKRCPSPMAGERRAWIKETAQAQGVSAMLLVLNSSHPAP